MRFYSQSITCGGLFLAGLAGSVALLHATDAAAAWVRVTSSSCYLQTALQWSAGGLLNTCSNCSDTFQCTLPETDLLRTLNIHGHDANSQFSVFAQACVIYWPSNGGECGAGAFSGNGFVGEYTISPALTSWNSAHSADFAYVVVALQPNDTLRGFWASQ